MNFLNVGDHGWVINEKSDIDEQQEKIDLIIHLTERSLQTLEKICSIYAKFAEPEAFSVFQGRVDEIMKKASHESFFSENSGQ